MGCKRSHVQVVSPRFLNMRLWSIHPKYLDTKGILALWRESLLAQKVLKGLTKGYKKHPQLERFKKTEDPVSSISQYLHTIYSEAESRHFKFDKDKIEYKKIVDHKTQLYVTKGQLDYEFHHLLGKLKKRDPSRYGNLILVNEIECNPTFQIVEGPVSSWEKIH